MAYSFKNNPTKKKKNPPKLKLTHSTQIKLTLKLDSNVIFLLSLLSLLPLFPLSKNLFHEWFLSFDNYPAYMGAWQGFRKVGQRDRKLDHIWESCHNEKKIIAATHVKPVCHRLNSSAYFEQAILCLAFLLI
jgi:hypothetical protein